MSARAALADLAGEFAFLDGWEDRYRYIIDLGKALPPLAEEARTEETRVRGCASQVWLVARREGGRLHLAGDSDAHIVRGLVAVLLRLYDGRTKAEIDDLPPEEAFAALGLAEALSAQRSNGLKAIAARIRAEAAAL